jgi:hypothetical protein
MIGTYLERLTKAGACCFLPLELALKESLVRPCLEFELVSLLFFRVSELVFRFAVLLFYR